MKAFEKLSALRNRMREQGLDAYIVSSADAHQSEYVTEHWRTRAWLTGFTGSNGLAAITADDAGLWTDGRYFIQAERQLAGSGVTMYKMDVDGVPDYRAWLAKKLPQNGKLGFDGRSFSVAEFDKIKDALKQKNIAFDTDVDLVGDIWEDRPPLPETKAFAHEARFAGASGAEKLAVVRREIQKRNASAYLIASPEDIAWLANIRGRDIPQTPVVYAYALITPSEAKLFVDPAKMDSALNDKLTRDGFTLCAYGDEVKSVSLLPPETRLLYDPERISARLAEAVPPSVKTIRLNDDITAVLKAVKSEVEVANIRNAHIKEGVVMVRFLKQLDEWAQNESRAALTEADLHGILTRLREEQAFYIEPSFDTIAAYAENAASMHYSPVKGADKAILPEGFLLVDTGGQYLDGTTDITRTIVMGALTDEMKRDFTLVLKGHIALASTVFLSGVTGRQLDAISRVPLWAAGMNYRSGTGHGIGYCLGVHEGPQSISMRANETKLAAGMLCTNEPGVYKEGRYGIRTENMMLVKELFTNEDGTFMGFELISFCPIDLKAVDETRLTPAETGYLNDYHKRVYETLSPLLNENERAWLKNATRPL